MFECSSKTWKNMFFEIKNKKDEYRNRIFHNLEK